MTLGIVNDNTSLAIILIGDIAYVYFVLMYLLANALVTLGYDANKENGLKLPNTVHNLNHNLSVMSFVSIPSSIMLIVLAIYYRQHGMDMMQFAVTETIFAIALNLLIPIYSKEMIKKEIMKRTESGDSKHIESMREYETSGENSTEDCGGRTEEESSDGTEVLPTETNGIKP